MPRVVIRKPEDHVVVSRRVVEQMRDAEVEPAAPREDLGTNVSRHRIRVAPLLRLSFRERYAHLHRTSRAHGIQVAEQTFAERHLAYKVLEQLAQFPLGPGPVQALPITTAVRRTEIESRAHQEFGDVVIPGASLNFATRNGGKAGHRWINLKVRFLIYNCQHTADVFRGHGDTEDFERGVD